MRAGDACWPLRFHRDVVGGGSPVMKKLLTWAGVAFLVFFVAFRPESAGNVVGTIAGTIGDIGAGFATFIANIVG